MPLAELNEETAARLDRSRPIRPVTKRGALHQLAIALDRVIGRRQGVWQQLLTPGPAGWGPAMWLGATGFLPEHFWDGFGDAGLVRSWVRFAMPAGRMYAEGRRPDVFRFCVAFA